MPIAVRCIICHGDANSWASRTDAIVAIPDNGKVKNGIPSPHHMQFLPTNVRSPFSSRVGRGKVAHEQSSCFVAPVLGRMQYITLKYVEML